MTPAKHFHRAFGRIRAAAPCSNVRWAPSNAPTSPPVAAWSTFAGRSSGGRQRLPTEQWGSACSNVVFIRARRCSFSATSFASEALYHHVADETLQRIFDVASALEDDGHDVEVSLSQGVLNIEVAEVGTWVLNKQAPNQQIWWSSPESGPMRFEFHETNGAWLSTRTKKNLVEDLFREISTALDIHIDIHVDST